MDHNALGIPLPKQAAMNIREFAGQLFRDADVIEHHVEPGTEPEFIDEVRYFIVQEAERLDTYLAGIRDELEDD